MSESKSNGQVVCYLTYESASQGVLFSNWSKTKIDDALASFVPSKPVPAFKITSNGGKTQIIDKCSGVNIKRYYQGFSSFIKLAREFKSVLTLHTTAVDVYLQLKTSQSVKKVLVDTAIDVDDNVQAVAAVPSKCDAFTVSTMDKSLFLAAGNEAGGALLLVL